MATAEKVEEIVPVIHILAFGDSLTEGWHRNGFRFHPYTSRLQELLLSIDNTIFKVNNHGVSGETTTNMAARLLKLLSQHEPYDFVIILAGTNDLGTYNDSAESLFHRIKCLHESVLEHNSRTVTVAVTLPETGYEVLSGYEYTRKKRVLVNESLMKFALDSKGRVILSDLCLKLPRHSLDPEDLDKHWDDGLHLTAHGYNKMAEILFEDIISDINKLLKCFKKTLIEKTDT